MEKNKKIIFGVCYNLSNRLGVDITIIRMGFLILTLLGFGMPIIIYILLAIFLNNKE